MNELAPDGQERNGLEKRDVRALTEYLTVLPNYGRADGADGLYMVVSESGSEYLVDTRLGACECPDHEYREVHCKHQRRVAYATGERAIPAWVDPNAVDPHLGAHVDTTPVLATTDGGIVEGTDADEGDKPDDERPDDCSCWDPDQGLPCWPCWRAGFETPNPNPEEGDE